MRKSKAKKILTITAIAISGFMFFGYTKLKTAKAEFNVSFVPEVQGSNYAPLTQGSTALTIRLLWDNKSIEDTIVIPDAVVRWRNER